jgi:Ca-activated chloride channel family protein
MTFLRPEFLHMGWGLLALALWCVYSLRSLAAARARLGVNSSVLTSRPSSLFRRAMQLTIGLLLLGCLILAIARPQTVIERRIADLRKLDVVLLLDISPSMRAQDIYPSRLARATEVIGTFIRTKLRDDRFGLVSFSDTSLTLSYLTSDPNNINFYLEYLRNQGVLQYGTNIGGALKNAIVVLTRQAEIESGMNRNKKVFILLSDGEDFGDGLRSAVDEAVKRDITVYSIGIGSRTGAYIPIGEENGKVQYLLGKDERPILTSFDESSLRLVADRSGGRYYRAYSGTDMTQAFNDIFLRSREIQGFRRVRELQERYRDFLLAAFGLLLVRVLI